MNFQSINKKKIFKICKERGLVFFFFFALSCWSTILYSQTINLNLKAGKVELKSIIKEIEKQADFDFLYNKEVERLYNHTEAVNIKNMGIEDALAILFKNSNIKWEVANKTIILSPVVNSKAENEQSHQGISVTGTVRDEKGEPVIGANVVQKGTTNGVISDIDGKYIIKVSDKKATLVYSFIGLTSQEIIVGNNTRIDVILKNDVQLLNEVVVIGYGTSSKKKLTTSVSSMKQEKLAELPIANVGDAFAGQMSGIVAENGTGGPGSAPVIRVRGYGSINAGSEPLYVIDGVMASASQFAALNPKSIETIDVLKDAAAGAIYGSRAGNGVIVVTTKKGKVGDAKFSVNATFGVQQLERKVDVLDTHEWLSLMREAYANENKEIPDFYNRSESSYANTDWQDEIFRTSTYQNYQIAASGGSEKFKYHIDANYLDNAGIIRTTYAKTYSSTGSFELQLKPRFKMGLNYTASHEKQRVNKSINGGAGHQTGGYGIAGGIIQQALWSSPILPVYEANGDYGSIWQQEFGETKLLDYGFTNPVANLLETHDEYTYNKVLARGYLTYEPIDGLELNASLNVVSEGYRREWHTSPYLAGSGSTQSANFSNPAYDKMKAGQENGMNSSWTTELWANYKKDFGKHSINATFGFSAQYLGNKSTTASSDMNDRGEANAANPIPPFDNYYRPNIHGAALILGGGGYQENTFESIFARLSYSYADRYLFMGSIRRDGSSKFAPDQRYGYFPAVSAAWRLSEEDFMDKLSWLNDLKVRASFGVSGNDQFGNYAWRGTVSYDNLYTYGPTDLDAGAGKVLLPSTFENPKLKWETNTQTNIGIDVSVLDNRINFTADYFIRKTKDMLLNKAVPSENGIVTSIFDNIGNMTNKGLELALNTRNIETRDFAWSTTFTFTKVSNKVDKVFSASGYLPYRANNFLTSSGFESALRIVEGEPMFQIYSYNVIGTFESQEQLDNYANPGGTATVGDPIIEDVDNNGVINGNDMKCVGNALPDFTYGITSTWRYKDFDLNVILDGSQGASKIITAARNASLMRPQENTLKEFYEDRYRPGETGHHMAIPKVSVTGMRHYNQSYYVRDASYLRIRNITLGYNLPQPICKKMSIDNLRFTLSIQNVFTFTKYPLYNPQSNTHSGQSGTAQFGVDDGTYPLARTYSLGLNITF